MVAVLNPLCYYTLHYGECQEKSVKNLVIGLWKSQASAVVGLQSSVFVLAIKLLVLGMSKEYGYVFHSLTVLQ